MGEAFQRRHSHTRERSTQQGGLDGVGKLERGCVFVTIQAHQTRNSAASTSRRPLPLSPLCSLPPAPLWACQHLQTLHRPQRRWSARLHAAPCRSWSPRRAAAAGSAPPRCASPRRTRASAAALARSCPNRSRCDAQRGGHRSRGIGRALWTPACRSVPRAHITSLATNFLLPFNLCTSRRRASAARWHLGRPPSSLWSSCRRSRRSTKPRSGRSSGPPPAQRQVGAGGCTTARHCRETNSLVVPHLCGDHRTTWQHCLHVLLPCCWCWCSCAHCPPTTSRPPPPVAAAADSDAEDAAPTTSGNRNVEYGSTAAVPEVVTDRMLKVRRGPRCALQHTQGQRSLLCTALRQQNVPQMRCGQRVAKPWRGSVQNLELSAAPACPWACPELQLLPLAHLLRAAARHPVHGHARVWRHHALPLLLLAQGTF